MTAIFARQALLPTGWHRHVRVGVAAGKISRVALGASAEPGDVTVDSLVPAMPNLHSHSFQRAMAGMSEIRGDKADSFWTWRNLMYRFLQHLTPEDIEHIAAFAFMEMLEAGYASVAEFHYLHNASGGLPYANRAELCARIMAGAARAGIGLTLLPVLYRHSGLGDLPLAPPQLRFGNSLDGYLRLHSEAKAELGRNMPPDSSLGVAPHSLRAVSMADIGELAKTLGKMPMHMHIAEQTAEVEAVFAATGQTPMAWLLNSVEVDHRWCLIHATHMTPTETAAFAKSSATAGLCPITEANLGDGIFNGAEYLRDGGRFGVGTDSNINISVSGELAMLEYGQRLRERQRNVMAQMNESTGQSVYLKAAVGGAQALGRQCGSIEVGHWADLLALDSNDIQLCALKPEQLLDGWLFASRGILATHVWSAGRHVVSSGRHERHDEITAAFRKTLKHLVSLL